MINLQKIRFDKISVKNLLLDRMFRVYLITSVLAGASLVFLFFRIIPDITSLSRISGSINLLNSQIDLTNSRVKKLGQMTDRLRELRKNKTDYAVKLPAENDIPELLDALSKMARNSKVKILSITPYPLKTDENIKDSQKYYKKMPVLITARAGYHELGAFVNSLETGQRLIIIEDLSVKSGKDDYKTHEVKLLLNAYVSVG